MGRAASVNNEAFLRAEFVVAFCCFPDQRQATVECGGSEIGSWGKGDEGETEWRGLAGERESS